MNYFFALELPSDIRSFAAGYCQNWSAKLESGQSVKWVLPEDYHITLKFLGNVKEGTVSELISAAAPVAARQSPLFMQLAPAGKFPTVLWVGVKPDYRLEKLASQVDAALEVLGFKPEQRSYQPHITVARYQQKHDRIAEELLAPHERAFPKWTTHQFVLMQTLPLEQRQNETKKRYNIVHTFPFGITQS